MSNFVAALSTVLNLMQFGTSDHQATRPMNAIRIQVIDASTSGTMTVEISNKSKEKVRLWRESNSWGAARWRVFVLRGGSVEVFYQNPDRHFTRNIPAADEIAAASAVKRTLDLNGGDWCGFNECSTHDQRGIGGKRVALDPHDSIVVVYDVPHTDEAVQMRVWYGVVAASATVK